MRPTPIMGALPKFDSTDVGCASLVAGTMVGAGVLALPAVSAPSGFFPATAVSFGRGIRHCIASAVEKKATLVPDAVVLVLPCLSHDCCQALIGVWAYMVASALLSAEVAEHSSCALGRPGGVSLLSQARLTLGPIGATFASLSYVFLHFAVSFDSAIP